MRPNEFTLFIPHPPANTSVQSDVCAEILVPPHPSTPVHTIRSCIHAFTHWPRLSTLARSVYTACLCPFLFYTCRYLFTPVYAAHACSHLPIPVLSGNYPCSSLALTPASLAPAPAHTYLRSFSCVLAPASRSLGALRLKVRLTETLSCPHSTTSRSRELLMEWCWGQQVGASLGVCGGSGSWPPLL